MARAYIADRGGKKFSFGADPFAYLWSNPTGARTAKELARIAKAELRLSVSASRLENEFAAKKKKVIAEEMHDDDVVRSIQTQGLEKIEKILKAHGVKVDVTRVL